MALKRKYGSLLLGLYQSYGFPSLTIETDINNEEKSDEYQQFLLAKQKEDQERGLMALADLQKKEAEKEQGLVFMRDHLRSDLRLRMILTFET